MEIDENMTLDKALQEVKDCEYLVKEAEEQLAKNQKILENLKNNKETSEEEIAEAEEYLKDSEKILNEYKEELEKAKKIVNLLEERIAAEIDKGAASVAQGNAMSKLDVATDEEKDLTYVLREAMEKYRAERPDEYYDDEDDYDEDWEEDDDDEVAETTKAAIQKSIAEKVAEHKKEYAAGGSWLKITLKDEAGALTKDEVQALLEEHKNDNIKYVYFADEQNHFGENLDLGDIGQVKGWGVFAKTYQNVLTLK